MIHDIFPYELKNEFASITPDSNADTGSSILIFNNNKVLVRVTDGKIEYPNDVDICDTEIHPIYLFKIDNTEYYLGSIKDKFSFDDEFTLGDFEYEQVNVFRETLIN